MDRQLGTGQSVLCSAQHIVHVQMHQQLVRTSKSPKLDSPLCHSSFVQLWNHLHHETR